MMDDYKVTPTGDWAYNYGEPTEGWEEGNRFHVQRMADWTDTAMTAWHMRYTETYVLVCR